MKTIPHLVISVVVAASVSAIAILSVQNATPVSLNFLFFQSIEIPVGVVLALSATAGILGGAIFQPLWSLPGGSRGAGGRASGGAGEQGSRGEMVISN